MKRENKQKDVNSRDKEISFLGFFLQGSFVDLNIFGKVKGAKMMPKHSSLHVTFKT